MDAAEECSICSSELDLDAGDIQGSFGILPIGFCVMCFSAKNWSHVISSENCDSPDVELRLLKISISKIQST